VDSRAAGGYQLRVLGLPAEVRACLFDLDGVLTRTASVHAAAWGEMFDEFLATRTPPQPRFTPDDYDRYVDGRTRLDGTRGFLASRGITLPEGTPGDPPGAPTVNGLATRKNDLVLAKIAAGGVDVYEGSVDYVRAIRAAGQAAAVVSSSANAVAVLESAGIVDLFDTVVDGTAVVEMGLAGKPAPDMFLEGARRLGFGPEAAAVFEDSLAGVAAGKAGHCALVVGVDRVGQAEELLASGADVVVRDLSELLAADEQDREASA
jgi:beta-phosphoglucomutase family hydrolase